MGHLTERKRADKREHSQVHGHRPWGRKIVVDGTEYMWRISGGTVTVRGEKCGYRTVGSTGRNRITENDWYGDRHFAVTPFDVANRIRVQIEKRQAVSRKPRPAFPADTGNLPEFVPAPLQPDVYLVLGSRTVDCGAPQQWIVTATLEPQVAKNMAAALNARSAGTDGAEFSAVAERLLGSGPLPGCLRA